MLAIEAFRQLVDVAEQLELLSIVVDQSQVVAVDHDGLVASLFFTKEVKELFQPFLGHPQVVAFQRQLGLLGMQELGVHHPGRCTRRTEDVLEVTVLQIPQTHRAKRLDVLEQSNAGAVGGRGTFAKEFFDFQVLRSNHVAGTVAHLPGHHTAQEQLVLALDHVLVVLVDRIERRLHGKAHTVVHRWRHLEHLRRDGVGERDHLAVELVHFVFFFPTIGHDDIVPKACGRNHQLAVHGGRAHPFDELDVEFSQIRQALRKLDLVKVLNEEVVTRLAVDRITLDEVFGHIVPHSVGLARHDLGIDSFQTPQGAKHQGMHDRQLHVDVSKPTQTDLVAIGTKDFVGEQTVGIEVLGSTIKGVQSGDRTQIAC